jgi:MFS family permease
VSLLGDGAFLVAIAWVTSTRYGTTAIAVVLGLQTVGMLTTLLVGGALADRYPRRAMMIVSDLTRFGLVSLLTVLDLRGELSVAVLAVIALCMGLASGIFRPAFGGIVPLLVPAAQLASANALIVLFTRLSIGVGPALGGALYGLGSSSLVFAVDAATFLVSVAFVLRVRPRPTERLTHEGTFRSIWNGLRYVGSVPWLWVTIFVFSFYVMLTIAPLQVLLPGIVREQYDLGPGSFGFLMGLLGFGQALGALACAQLGLHGGRGRLSYLLWTASAALVVVIAVAPWYWLASVSALARGICWGFASTIWATILMELVPERLLSRVVSVDFFGSTGLMPIGFVLAGAAASVASSESVLVAGAVLSSALLLAGLAHGEVRSVQ